MQAIWIFLFVFCFSVASAANTNRHNEVDNAEAVIVVKAEDITYYFCNRLNGEGVAVKYNNISAAEAVFDPKKETLIQIHGWMDGYNLEFNNVVKDAVLSTQDINVIVADWSKVGNGEYLLVKSQLPKVSAFMADFVMNFTETFGYSVSQIRLVGHSLGAHVSGFVGTYLGGNISQIVGLDPAGPFISNEHDHCLDKSDAKFVQVIHTSWLAGMSDAVGHADYYPNGGNSQPGCGLDLMTKCAHFRAFEFYAESVKSGGFYAMNCSNYEEFESKKCNGSISLMGGYDVSRATGLFYLDTNPDSPYAEGQIKKY